MRKHLWFAIGCAAASQLACGFILDFDSLTGGAQPALADGGLDASAGCVCDDQDPCTVDSCADGGCKFTPIVCVASDSCHVSVCNAGQCEESAPGGFVDDGYERTLEGDIFRTTTTAAGSRFYVATYGNFDDKRDIVLNVFEAIASDDAGTNTREFVETRIAKIFPDDSIVSPAALVVDKRYLNVYFATRSPSSLPNGAGQLRRVRFSVGANVNAAQPTLTQVDVGVMSSAPNFRVNGETLGPAAGLLAGGTPFVVWPGCATDGNSQSPMCTVTSSPLHGIYVVSGDPDFQVSPSLFPEAGTVTGLTALSNGTAPGASWIAGPDLTETTIRTAFLSNNGNAEASQELSQCEALPSTTQHALASAATTDGTVRVLGWSQQHQAQSTAQFRTFTCNTETCSDSASACDAAENNLDGVSNLDFTLLPQGSTAAWFRSTAFVTGNGKASALSLVLSQLPGTAAELADAGVDAGVELDATTGSDAGTSLSGWSSQANVLSANATSVDWPSIAANGDRVVVAWSETGSDNKKVRHLVRQRVCFPE
jgi:Dictyostelium (slime mold) repeat